MPSLSWFAVAFRGVLLLSLSAAGFPFFLSIIVVISRGHHRLRFPVRRSYAITKSTLRYFSLQPSILFPKLSPALNQSIRAVRDLFFGSGILNAKHFSNIAPSLLVSWENLQLDTLPK